MLTRRVEKKRRSAGARHVGLALHGNVTTPGSRRAVRARALVVAMEPWTSTCHRDRSTSPGSRKAAEGKRNRTRAHAHAAAPPTSIKAFRPKQTQHTRHERPGRRLASAPGTRRPRRVVLVRGGWLAIRWACLASLWLAAGTFPAVRLRAAQRGRVAINKAGPWCVRAAERDTGLVASVQQENRRQLLHADELGTCLDSRLAPRALVQEWVTAMDYCRVVCLIASYSPVTAP